VTTREARDVVVCAIYAATHDDRPPLCGTGHCADCDMLCPFCRRDLRAEDYRD
jgi:hypothetical protein